MRHAGKHSWSVRRQLLGLGGRLCHPTPVVVWFLIDGDAGFLRCWVSGFPWNRVCLAVLCGGFFFNPAPFQLGELSRRD